MPPAILETPRLQMRQMTTADVAPLLKIFGDVEAMQFYPAIFDGHQMQKWVAWNQHQYASHGYGLWALVLRSTTEVIGDCGLVNQPMEGVPEIEIGYHVRRDHWRQGIATEAALACRNYGFEHLGCCRLVSLIHPQNLASRRVAEKVGMSYCREIFWKHKPTCLYAVERTGA